MPIKYFPADDMKELAIDIAEKLGMRHDMSRVAFVRSHGSQSRRIIARCHGMPRIMQFALGVRAYYVIEIISERFDSMGSAEKEKTIIHELMHIPKSFGGGFRHHDHVTRQHVEAMWKKLKD